MKSNHFAPAIESSKSGESIAALAASTALFSPEPYQIPISADHAFFITDFTSAKSTLISPGCVIRSETHCTHSLNTSSTIEKASKSGVFLSIIVKILSFGIVINVSTFSFKALYASKAFPVLDCPSNENGFVTTQTVSAQSHFAISAITGAAQEPVPQPSPQVINTISAHSKAALISSDDSSAAFFHISGFAPAPSPPVVALQILIFLSAKELYNA